MESKGPASSRSDAWIAVAITVAIAVVEKG